MNSNVLAWLSQLDLPSIQVFPCSRHRGVMTVLLLSRILVCLRWSFESGTVSSSSKDPPLAGAQNTLTTLQGCWQLPLSRQYACGYFVHPGTTGWIQWEDTFYQCIPVSQYAYIAMYCQENVFVLSIFFLNCTFNFFC